jgi:hypothetical protein
MAGSGCVPRHRQCRADKPERDERQVRHDRVLVDPHAAPEAGGGERDRERATRAGERGGRHATCRPQEHATGEVAADMIHLADERDRRTEDDRTDGAREIGEL